MHYRNLGHTGLKVSAVCLGTMAFGRWSDPETSLQIVDEALALGINFIDTADMYGPGQDTGNWQETGAAETILGRALQGRRHQVVLATKVWAQTGPAVNDRGLSRKHVLDACDASLRRLGTDYIDLYQVHRFDPETPLEETLGTLHDLVRAGKVRYIGCSNYAAWQLCKALWVSDRRGWERYVSVQPPYSILQREIEAELLPLCQDQGIGTLVYSPLARGLLAGKYRWGEAPPEGSRRAAGEARLDLLWTRRNFAIVEAVRTLAGARGKTPAEFALAWVLGNPVITSAIVGPSRPGQLTATVGGIGWTLTPEERQAVDAACARA